MASERSTSYFRYRFLVNNGQTLSKATRWAQDSNGVKVRFTKEYRLTSMHVDSEMRTNESLGDLLWTRKGKCLFQADAGHGQVCSPFCTTGVFHAEKDYHDSIDLRETREMGIGVFAKKSIPKGKVLGLYSGVVRPYDQLTPAQKPYSNFLFRHPQHGEFYVDASTEGNWTRFLNHACERPNCSFARALHCGNMRVIYARTTRPVRAGEQLFVDYGRDYFESIECKCGSKSCPYITAGEKRQIDEDFEYESPFPDEFREAVRALSPSRDGLRATVKVRRLIV